MSRSEGERVDTMLPTPHQDIVNSIVIRQPGRLCLQVNTSYPILRNARRLNSDRAGAQRVIIKTKKDDKQSLIVQGHKLDY